MSVFLDLCSYFVIVAQPQLFQPARAESARLVRQKALPQHIGYLVMAHPLCVASIIRGRMKVLILIFSLDN